jgi:hypothetical protein
LEFVGHFDKEEIREHAIKADRDDLEDKVERWAYLMKIQYDGYMFSPVVSQLYYTEAKYCWYHGDYIATIVLSQMAMEDLVRHHFEVARHGKFLSGKKIDGATFKCLIDEALAEGYIEKGEAKKLHHLRKKLRNPYVHTDRKDVKVHLEEKGEFKETSLPNFMALSMKIRQLSIIDKNVQDEAKEAITILIKVFTSIVLKSHGL